MATIRTLRLATSTRNQSAADYSRQNIFIYGNRYYESTIVNKATTSLLVEDGILLMRDSADATKVTPILTAADLPKVIGISKSTEKTIVAGASLNINFCIKGDVDGALLKLPGTTTLNTLVGDKTVKDLLTGLGFCVLNVTDNSKFDN